MTNSKLVLVTGASRGIGREIVIQSISKISPSSTFILTSRQLTDLEKVKQDILVKASEAKVYLLPCELSKWDSKSAQEFGDLFKKVIAEHPSSFESFYLFHNAGSIGDLSKKSGELSNLDDWATYLHANFLSMIAINNLALKIFTEKIVKQRIIVNITSLLAIKAFPSATQYSCGKAIREAFFRNLAEEHKDLQVLSYSPGPVDTDMHDELANRSYDEGMRNSFKRGDVPSEVNRKTLTPTETVEKMFKILAVKKYISGLRVDYFDEE